MNVRKFLFALVFCVLASSVGAQNIADFTFEHELEWTGHYIKWVKYTPVIADSFTYRDTLITEDADTVAITWTSHPQTMKCTPTTTNGYNFVDTFLFSADTYVVLWTADGSATVGEAVDSFVAVGNALTDLKDSIRFEDSATYLIFRDKKNGPRAARWSTACNSRLADTTAAGRLTTVAMVCDSIVAKWNANATAAAATTAYDSTTLYHVRSDDSDLVYTIKDVANDSQAIAIISPAVDWVDTTWYQIGIPGGLSSYSYVWMGYEYDATLGGMATKDTLWADLQRGITTSDMTAYSTVKAGVLSHDSAFTTTGWNLENYYRAATAGDSLLRYPYLWLRVIDRQHLLDSGASLDVYQDSIWVQKLHVLVRGIK